MDVCVFNSLSRSKLIFALTIQQNHMAQLWERCCFSFLFIFSSPVCMIHHFMFYSPARSGLLCLVSAFIPSPIWGLWPLLIESCRVNVPCICFSLSVLIRLNICICSNEIHIYSNKKKAATNKVFSKISRSNTTATWNTDLLHP